MSPDIPSNSIPALLRDLRNETTTLLRQEMALAKTELKENASHFGHHAIQIAAGGFIAYAGLIVLLFGLGALLEVALTRAGVNSETAHWIGYALIGLAVAAVGWVLLAKARHALAADDLTPRRTVESLRENKEWAQSKLHHSS